MRAIGDHQFAAFGELDEFGADVVAEGHGFGLVATDGDDPSSAARAGAAV